MSHSRIYHFEYDKNNYIERDEDTVFEEMPYADYVEEINVDKDETEWLLQNLICIFGDENIIHDDNGLLVTIKKEGALEYFKRLRANLYATIGSVMDKPITEFIGINSNRTSWWQIKELIDSHYEAHFFIDDESIKTPTQFAEYILLHCEIKNTDSVTLKLKQVFDFHF